MFSYSLGIALLGGILMAGNLAAEDPFLGKWKLDLAKSKLTGQTIRIREVSKSSFEFQEDEHTDVIFADGLDHPTHFGETMAIMQKSPDLWSIIYKKGDQVLLNTLWKVSRDGKTLTYTATGTRPNGQSFHNEMTAKRTSGDKGLAGTWETTGVKLSSPRRIYIEAYGSDGQVITFPGRKQTIRMKFDGKEYNEEGPRVEAGSTSSGRRVDERTIETTERVKGKIVETATATISPDGRTQTITVTEPGDNTPVVLVYEREVK
jgi:hypothetical protein